MGAGREKGSTDDCVDRGEKESKETGGMKGRVGPLWCGCRRTGSQPGPGLSPAQPQVSPGRKWRVSPSDKLFLQNKEIIRKMTAGPADGKPGKGGGELRDLPPSISRQCSASPSPPSESKWRHCGVVLKEIPALRVTLHLVPNFSSSISHLDALIWHAGSRSHTSAAISYGPRGRWSASKPLKYSDMQTPKSGTASLGLKAPGSGADPWQSRRVAATPGPRLHGLLGAKFQPKVFHKHFL